MRNLALSEKLYDDYEKLIKIDEMIKYFENELEELKPILENQMYMVERYPVLNYRKDIILSKINALKAHKEFILYGENIIYKKE